MAKGVSLLSQEMRDKEAEYVEEMMGGDGCNFSEIDVWRIIHGFQQVEVSHLFPFFFLIWLCLLVGPHPPNGYNPPLRGGFLLCCVCCFLLCLFSGLISSF
jgi:hypothetical protein